MAKEREIIFQFRLDDDPAKNNAAIERFLRELERTWEKNEEVRTERESIRAEGGTYEVQFRLYVPKLSTDSRGIEIVGTGEEEYDQLFELAILVLEERLQKKEIPYIMRASKERFTAGFEDLHMKLDEIDEVLKEKKLTEAERKEIVAELSGIVSKLDFLALNIRLIEDRIVEMMNRYELEIPKSPPSAASPAPQPAVDFAINRPRDDFVQHFSAGSGYFDLGLYKEAAEEFARAIAIDKKDFGARTNLAWAYLLDNKIDAAIDKFHEILKARPDYVHAYNGLGYALLRADRLFEARTAFQKVLESPAADKNTRYFAHINLGLLYEKENDPDRAIQEFEKAGALLPNNPDAYFNIANVYYNLGLYDEAERKYKKTLELKPGSIPVKHYLLAAQAQMAIQDRSFDKAKTLYQQILADKPAEPIFYNNFGSLLEKIGDYHGALDAYKDATRLDPSYAISYFNLGYICDRMMNARRAISYYKKFLEFHPDDKIALNNLGWDFFVLGENDKAIYYYKKAAALDDQFTYPVNNLGWLYIKTGKYEEAATCYAQVLKKDPKNALAYNDLGYLYYLKGMYDHAIVELKKSIKFAKKDDVAYVYAYYHLGLVYHTIGKEDRALEAFTQALATDDKYVSAHEKVGELYESLGNFKKAREHYKRCLELLDTRSSIREKIHSKLQSLSSKEKSKGAL